MKNSLNAKHIHRLLPVDSLKFKTENLSFICWPTSQLAFAFSLSRRLGYAVDRNRFKRRARALLCGPLFARMSFSCIIKPLRLLKTLPPIYNDFVGFQNHLSQNLKNKRKQLI